MIALLVFFICYCKDEIIKASYSWIRTKINEETDKLFTKNDAELFDWESTLKNKKLQLTKSKQLYYDNQIIKPVYDGNVYIKDNKGACIGIVVLNSSKSETPVLVTDKNDLKHVNRNSLNAKPKGNLKLIKVVDESWLGKAKKATYIESNEAYYEDEAGCIWGLYTEKASEYHDPRKNYKFVHVDDKGGSHEVVVKNLTGK